MFTHVMVGTADPEQARAFYTAVLGTLGHQASAFGDRTFFRHEGGAFGVAPPRDGAASHANGGTIGFRAKTTAEVDAFHAAGLANGGADEGAPGVRPMHPAKHYGAYLRDPDGNKICAFAPNPDA